MNEIKIFKDEVMAGKSIEDQMQMFGSLCYLLAVAVEAEDKEFAWKTLREASKLGHVLDAPAFNTLYATAAMEVARNHKKNQNNPKTVMDRIKEVFKCMS